MSFNMYSVPHKTWDEFDNLIPNVEYSPGIRPAGEFRVAPWLPSADGLYSKQQKDFFTIAPGKILALTRDGWVVPAGFGLKLRAADLTDYVLQYSQNDVDARAMSIVRRAPVAAIDLTTNGGSGYTKGHIQTALQNAGILRVGESVDNYISSPVGVAPYAFKMSENQSSDPRKYIQNPRDDRFHNFRTQHQVAILCDYVLELPLVPGQQSAAIAGATWGAIHAATATQSGLWYAIATNAGIIPVAQDNDQLPWVFATDAQGLFANRADSIRDISRTGDYFVDADLNRLYFFHGGANTAAVEAHFNVVALQVYHYNFTTDTAINSRNFACVVGDVQPGDLLKPTVNSNFIKATAVSPSFAGGTVSGAFNQSELQGIVDNIQAAVREESLILGQVLEVRHHPRGLLGDVRTIGAENSWTGALMQDRLPGSATGGRPDKLTYAQGANKTVTINIIRK